METEITDEQVIAFLLKRMSGVNRGRYIQAAVYIDLEGHYRHHQFTVHVEPYDPESFSVGSGKSIEDAVNNQKVYHNSILSR